MKNEISYRDGYVSKNAMCEIAEAFPHGCFGVIGASFLGANEVVHNTHGHEIELFVPIMRSRRKSLPCLLVTTKLKNGDGYTNIQFLKIYRLRGIQIKKRTGYLN